MNNLPPWNERPVEIANLFNPAFCALLFRYTITGFQKVAGKGLDFPLAFLILPIILHKFSREILPTTTRTKMHIWIQEHQEARIGFDKRVVALSQFTKESIVFGLQYNLIEFDKDGALIASKSRLKSLGADTSEAYQCLEKANMIGRWFADAGNTATILGMWGIYL